MKELTTRTPLEVFGNLGYVPLYRDVRRIVMKDLYKDYKKASKDSKKKGAKGLSTKLKMMKFD